MTIFLAELIRAFVLSAVRPLLHALPMLLIVDPVALILGTVRVRVLSVAVSFVILPVAIVDVTVGMDEPAPPIRLIVLPVALIDASVTPYLIPSTMLLPCLPIPLTLILCTI